MLENQGVCVVQFVHRDVYHEILFGQRHILIHLPMCTSSDCASDKLRIDYLERFIEVANFTQIIEELVDASFVVLNEGVQRHHVGFLGVGGLVGQILQHFGDLEYSQKT